MSEIKAETLFDDMLHIGRSQIFMRSKVQAEATREAQKAGIEHAKAKGTTYRGKKPSFTRTQYQTVRDMLAQEAGISTIEKVTGLSRLTIYRIDTDPVGSEAALASWGL